VDATAAALRDAAANVQGRVVQSQVTHERGGRVTARLVFDVPLAEAPRLVERTKETGTVRVHNAARNPQAPEGPLATARLDVHLSNAEPVVTADEGLWPQVRNGLRASFVGLAWSLSVLIVGVLFVLPWVAVIYVIYRIVARLRRRPAGAAPAA
jgi:hypothetical protein